MASMTSMASGVTASKTLLGAKRGGMAGARLAVAPRGGVKSARAGAGPMRVSANAFIPDELKHVKKDRTVITPGTPEFGKGVVGLSEQQISMLGLTGEQDFRRPKMDPFRISARASYRKESPSEENPPVSMVTAMSGASMSAGGMAGSGAGPPPDLPSLLLNARIVYIGMPLLPAVTELVVAELLFLNYEQNDKPAYIYIMSAGSVNDKGEAVGVDSEAYAILDTMRYIKPRIHTVAVGRCYGNAAMLLAAGDKGCRHALPNAQIKTHPPKLNRTFDTAVNVQIRANEVEVCEDTYMEFMSEFTGRPVAEVTKDMNRQRYFTPQGAIEYGLIDKIIQKGTDVLEKNDYEGMLRTQQAMEGGRSRGAPSRSGRE